MGGIQPNEEGRMPLQGVKALFSQEIVQLFTGDVQGLGQSINMGVLKNHSQFLLPGCSLPWFEICARA